LGERGENYDLDENPRNEVRKNGCSGEGLSRGGNWNLNFTSCGSEAFAAFLCMDS